MQVLTKKHPTDKGQVILTLHVQREHVPEIKAFVNKIEKKRNCSVDEVFADLKENEQGTTLRGYRYREGLTQRQLAEQAGIPQRHVSEMENGKRPLGKDNARKLAKILNTNYRFLL